MISHVAAASTGEPLTWFLLRSTGVVALCLLTLSTVLGIVGPAITRPSWRLSSVSVHSVAAASGLLLLVGHVAFAVLDSFVDIPLAAVFVPGMSVWEPLWVGLGTVAVDLLIIVAITSALRGRAPLTWRRAHVLAYPAWFLAWGHALTAGTDGTTEPMLILAAVSAIAVGGAMVLRLRAVGRRPVPMTTPGDARRQPVGVGGGVR